MIVLNKIIVSGNVVRDNDVKDTALGDKAVAGDINIGLELETTVTQLD